MPGEKKKEKKLEDGSPSIHAGVHMFPNGDKYEGEYILTEGNSIERSGLGKHTAIDMVVYNGNWVSDKMNGTGTLEHPSGARYEGNFVDNQFHGHGRYIWPNGSYYEGEFVENRMEGDGKFMDTNNQEWTGLFRYKAAPGLRFKLHLG